MQTTTYSARVPGDVGNYEWPVRFDWTRPDGYLGITQWDDDGTVKDRVLLSPAQVRALRRFLQHPIDAGRAPTTP